MVGKRKLKVKAMYCHSLKLFVVAIRYVVAAVGCFLIDGAQPPVGVFLA